MSTTTTTTKTLDITLLLKEQDDPNDTKTRKISTPCGDATAATIKTRISQLNQKIADWTSTVTGGLDDVGRGIRITFQEEVKEGNETYVYIPNTITKAELVTITEDVIYGN